MATFTFHNPSVSSYFTLELIRRPEDGFYPTSSIQHQYFSGSNFSNITSSVTNPTVEGKYVWSCVVPPGTSSIDFTPGITIPVSQSMLRGTGEYNLILTT
jgi:hypothetical protein